jgi:molybdopterin molybdotransferase
MRTVDEARAVMLSILQAGGTETIRYNEADGRVLASPIIAQRTQPPFAASAMDGFAVRSEDLGDAPARLKLTGESAAGHSHSGCVAPGTAVHISTGAPIPAGADQVVIRERSTLDEGHIVLDDTSRPNSNIRHAGIDFHQGDTLLPAGTRLSPDAIALVAGAGLVSLDAYQKPRIGILSTGDELVEPGESTGPDQIINSISKGMDGLVRAWGGTPVYLGIARDTPDEVRTKLNAGDGLDLVVTIGGASVGDHDHLRQVFEDEGGKLEFEKVAVKPGKPTWFGRLNDVPYLGLPGNPVSSLVIARLFLKSAIGALCGRSDLPVLQAAILGENLPANGTREVYIRAECDPLDGSVGPLKNQDSSALSALVRSTLLIRRCIDAPAARVGDRVEILPL